MTASDAEGAAKESLLAPSHTSDRDIGTAKPFCQCDIARWVWAQWPFGWAILVCNRKTQLSQRFSNAVAVSPPRPASVETSDRAGA